MAHGPYVTQLETAEMIRLYGDGYSLAEIGNRLGRHHSTVRSGLVAAGEYYPRPMRQLNSHEVAGVIDWYQRGVRVRDIMARFGVTSTSVIYRHLRRNGVALRGRSSL